jgi:nicotinate-nucleotide adenylyltransferase
MLGIFGGTFDPIHYGHIKPALSVKQALNLSQLRFVPNRVPPHRDTPWLSSAQRLVLLKTALQDYPDIIVDERELKRDGPSYMVDTLKSLKQEFPDEQLCLIIGMDAFYGISAWFEWRSIFDLCQLVVTTRPGFDRSEVEAQMSHDDYQFLAQRITDDVKAFTAQASFENSPAQSPQEPAKILLQSVPQLDISSTKIRENVLNSEKISQWMPPQAYRKLRGFIDDN